MAIPALTPDFSHLPSEAQDAIGTATSAADFPSSKEKIIVQLWANPNTNKIYTSTIGYSFEPCAKTGILGFFKKDSWDIKSLPRTELNTKNKNVVRENIEFIQETFNDERIIPFAEDQGAARHRQPLVDEERKSEVNQSDDFVDIRAMDDEAEPRRSIDVMPGKLNKPLFNAKEQKLTQPDTETFDIESVTLKEPVWGPSRLQYFVRILPDYQRAQKIVLHMFNNIGKADASVSFDYKTALFFTSTYKCPFTGDELNHSNAVQINIFLYLSTFSWLTVSRQGVRAFLTSNLSQFPNLTSKAIHSETFKNENIRAISANSMEDGYMTKDTFYGENPLDVYSNYKY
ncbi:MAG: hypothetical protein HAW66_09485 [Shewanella sp.]|nr:hypothetical protein [Shewanella sp.]